MVALNCAGLPDSLLESELFGHTRGSFTGAYRDKPGLLEMAPNGTVFLDEVGEMSTRMQVVLLRFLETGEIQRVGADRAQTRVNVRLITATNRDLEAEIINGTFREDLFFRLNVVRLAIPPLRERLDDIPALIEYYLNWYGQQHRSTPPEVSPDAMDAMMVYRWPGNIRELRNVVERIVLKTGGQTVR
jgi:transcriptional regulator with PAS, ATPase and Fis domain